MEKTLFILKPDSVKRGLVGKIVTKVEDRGLRVQRMELMTLTRERAAAFYAEHEGKPFLNDLLDYMTSGPCVPMVVSGENAQPRLREIMGATNPKDAAPGTIRAEYGVDVGTNSVHGSDSPESAKREIPFFFPDESV